ncbi:hypothetical protein [Kineococcus sp. SYSU DK003]|uniref:hypothetical protein n=1 Tax=Kineococcus sp. SYSU DK003 TaxID=3383124 RepID=UPI003D7D3408
MAQPVLRRRQGVGRVGPRRLGQFRVRRIDQRRDAFGRLNPTTAEDTAGSRRELHRGARPAARRRTLVR